MTEFVELIRGGSVATVLAVALWVALVGAFKEWWIPGPTHTRLRAELRDAQRKNDVMLRLLLRSSSINDSALNVILDATVSTEK